MASEPSVVGWAVMRRWPGGGMQGGGPASVAWGTALTVQVAHDAAIRKYSKYLDTACVLVHGT